MGCSIVHFSATGKTLKVAEAVAKGLGGVGRLIDLSRPDFKGASLSSSDKVIVACPVYGGRIPSVVAERIKAVKFDATRVVTVVSYGNRAFEDALLELNDCVIAQGGVPVRQERRHRRVRDLRARVRLLLRGRRRRDPPPVLGRHGAPVGRRHAPRQGGGPEGQGRRASR